MFLAGPSGAGKSTSLRLPLREELTSDGDLKVLGRDPEDTAIVAGTRRFGAASGSSFRLSG
jgi:ABC-type ATPase involved in cell division